MSATPPSRNAARSRSLPVTGDFFCLLSVDVQSFRDDLDVLVAAPREVDNDVPSGPDLFGHRLSVEDRVRCLERRDDAFEARAVLEGLQSLLVGYARVLDQARVLEVGVLGADGRV